MKGVRPNCSYAYLENGSAGIAVVHLECRYCPHHSCALTFVQNFIPNLLTFNLNVFYLFNLINRSSSINLCCSFCSSSNERGTSQLLLDVEMLLLGAILTVFLIRPIFARAGRTVIGVLTGFNFFLIYLLISYSIVFLVCFLQASYFDAFYLNLVSSALLYF